jgi:hypothetical protein
MSIVGGERWRKRRDRKKMLKQKEDIVKIKLNRKYR